MIDDRVPGTRALARRAETRTPRIDPCADRIGPLEHYTSVTGCDSLLPAQASPPDPAAGLFVVHMGGMQTHKMNLLFFQNDGCS